MSPPPLVLLGPQGSGFTVREALRGIGDPAPVALVTAGWQEREGEDDELRRHLGVPSTNLGLYERAQRIAAEDPKLRDAHRRRQEGLKLLRRAYNLRLARLMEAWRELALLRGDPDVLEPEREAALESIRRLDAEHLARVERRRADFDQRLEPAARPAVRRERGEVTAVLERAAAVVIAGGHVAVLLNRMRLFGLRDAFASRPVVAWSAGAMALAERVVLFHDSPPQGPGNAEAFDLGLGLFDDLLPLPHGSRRLRRDDPERSARFARRFGPAWCALLDGGVRLVRLGSGWRAPSGGRRLSPDGGTLELPR